ncbi:MAG TPA: hypothetical protein VGJ00_09345 [Rhabdochlamydiaceae bacterium]|jgi:hypothetical protein
MNEKFKINVIFKSINQRIINFSTKVNMKKRLSIIFGSIFALSVAYSNENALEQKDLFNMSKKYPNNIYFGPEAFVFDLKTHFKGVKVQGTKFFSGLRLGYEYLKPKSFYFGTDLLLAVGNKSFDKSYKRCDFPRSNASTTFSSLEFRFGRTFASAKKLVTPFLGFGGCGFLDGTPHYYYNEDTAYFTGGVKYKQQITSTFTVGLNAKVLVSFATDDRFRYGHLKRYNSHGRWGGEIGIPFTCYLGSAKRWNIQLEPYFLSLDFSETQNIYGTRLLFDYRF